MQWYRKSLREVCSKLTDGTHFSPESFPSGDFMYITAKNIRETGIDLSDISFVPESVHRPIYDRCNPEKGDILYIKDGATTGIAAINQIESEFSLLSSVALLKYDRTQINGFYLRSLLNHPAMYAEMRSKMSGCAITRLTVAKLNATIISVPPLDLQEQFAYFVQQSDKSKLFNDNT